MNDGDGVKVCVAVAVAVRVGVCVKVAVGANVGVSVCCVGWIGWLLGVGVNGSVGGRATSNVKTTMINKINGLSAKMICPRSPNRTNIV